MWHTIYGKKVFDGYFGTLIAGSIASMIARTRIHGIGEPLTTGSNFFDRLTCEQQIVAIFEVGSALLLEEVEMPIRKAYHDATLIVIFQAMERCICEEISINEYMYRDMLLESHVEIFGHVRHGIVKEQADMECWKVLLENIKVYVRCDQNFMDVDESICDLDPSVANILLSRFHIDTEYFMAFPKDPSNFEAKMVAKQMLYICQSVMTRFLLHQSGEPNIF